MELFNLYCRCETILFDRHKLDVEEMRSFSMSHPVWPPNVLTRWIRSLLRQGQRGGQRHQRGHLLLGRIPRLHHGDEVLKFIQSGRLFVICYLIQDSQTKLEVVLTHCPILTISNT